MSARHDLGIAGQGPRRVIDVVPIGGIQGVEPVASGLKRDAEMDGAGLAAGEAGDHQDRPIAAKDRTVGTMTGSMISRVAGRDGLPADTVQLNFKGSAGNSFGAFVPAGMTLTLTGDANDYVGKGLSGGRIIIQAPSDDGVEDLQSDIIAGNVLGFLDNTGEAKAGVEQLEESCLAPVDGEKTYRKGKDGVVIPGSESVTDAVNGGTVQLTINSDLQWYLQQMIGEEAQKQGAKGGTVFAEGPVPPFYRRPR
mgnify:CR=1 FL=1